MSLATAFRNALVRREKIVGTTVFLPFTQQCAIGDIGRVYYDGWRLTNGLSSLPIKVPKTRKSGISKLTVSADCEVDGDLELAASTVLESGGTATGSAKITFKKKTSLYFFVPSFYTEEVEEGPEPFGKAIWKAKPHKFKLFDNCVYRTYNAQSGVYLGTRTAGMSLTLTGNFKNVGESVSGSFTISNQTNDVVHQQYNPKNDPNNMFSAFACDFLRWRPGGKVIVDPIY